jgi:hypothetical protein
MYLAGESCLVMPKHVHHCGITCWEWCVSEQLGRARQEAVTVIRGAHQVP